MAPQESLLKVYGDRSYRHVTMARHQGTAIAFAMDASRRVVYSVLDLSGPPAKGDADAAYWSENPAELLYPGNWPRWGTPSSVRRRCRPSSGAGSRRPPPNGRPPARPTPSCPPPRG
ncbi:hypothetical protein ACIA6C_30325 [Streptomyces sp. NPDC051578]|uniref:hypothetical protein n=1 Tax=Streptomyces sp. NPDC051578 TaxID=3365662 RepID=UPI00379638DC